MKKFTILAELTCLNKLVNGKVIVINVNDNTYNKYNPSQYCNIKDGFNPENYALLETDKYSVIVDATPKMREQYLVNKIWQEQCKDAALKNKQLIDTYNSYKVGDKIHLKSKDGIYTITSVSDHYVTISCKKWEIEGKCNMLVNKDDIKCKAGGIYSFGL